MPVQGFSADAGVADLVVKIDRGMPPVKCARLGELRELLFDVRARNAQRNVLDDLIVGIKADPRDPRLVGDPAGDTEDGSSDGAGRGHVDEADARGVGCARLRAPWVGMLTVTACKHRGDDDGAARPRDRAGSRRSSLVNHAVRKLHTLT